MGLGQRHALTAFLLGKRPLPIVQEAGWAPGPVWTGEEKLIIGCIVLFRTQQASSPQESTTAPRFFLARYLIKNGMCTYSHLFVVDEEVAREIGVYPTLSSLLFAA